MITVKEFMEVVDYRVTEGSDFLWACFGDTASPYSLSAWNGDHDGWSFTVTFDTKTQTVYMVEASDYRNDRAYRLINPDYRETYMNYGKTHHPNYLSQAWDDVDYIDLEENDDWIQKALAIKEGKDYDTKVSVPLELDDSEIFQLMKMAHERDITLNQLVEEILWKVINNNESSISTATV